MPRTGPMGSRARRGSCPPDAGDERALVTALLHLDAKCAEGDEQGNEPQAAADQQPFLPRQRAEQIVGRHCGAGGEGAESERAGVQHGCVSFFKNHYCYYYA